jgi:hypothetical protein
MKNLRVAGWIGCGAYRGAKTAVSGLSAIFPKRVSLELQECKYLLIFNN